jgi:murein DD-endopeptidase MepM/ murein hydrolase activator NlpD
METRRSRRGRPLAVTVALAAVVVGALTTPLGASEPGRPTTKRTALERAQERLDEARGFATAVAEKIAAARTQQAELEVEIAHTEVEIPALRAQADELRRIVRERAVRLYKRGATPKLENVVNTGNVVDAARAAHLTETIGAHDQSVAGELQDAARQLEERQAVLRSQRQDLADTIASLEPLEALLRTRLQQADALYQKVREARARHGDQPDVSTAAALCPVQGLVVFTDDFGEPRDIFRLHEGIDMRAHAGTPVVAVVDGVLTRGQSENGGTDSWLDGVDDVSYYYYAHFTRHEGASRIVAAGDVIGYVGSTGHSTGPHLHFEVHPGHGPAVNGYTLLVGLCDEETSAARDRLAARG